jgi:hypothetical protein
VVQLVGYGIGLSNFFTMVMSLTSSGNEPDGGNGGNGKGQNGGTNANGEGLCPLDTPEDILFAIQIWFRAQLWVCGGIIFREFIHSWQKGDAYFAIRGRKSKKA